METISLGSYIIRIKKKKRKSTDDDEYVLLDDIDSGQTSYEDTAPYKELLNILNNTLQTKKQFKNESEKKVISLENKTLKNRMFYGLVDYGKYGKKSKTKNTETFEEVILDEKTAVTAPFYFLLYVPPDEDEGILILERKGREGMKVIFKEWLNNMIFKKQLHSFELEIIDYLPKAVIKDYMDKGDIVAFDFSETPSHKDGINVLSKSLNKIKGKFTVRMKVSKGYGEAAKDFLNNLMNKEINLDEGGLIEINEDNVDLFRAEIKIGNSTRKFNIQGNSIRPYMDITDDIENIDGGIPDFSEIHKIAKSYAEHLLKLK